MLARALAQQPRVLLLDEPTAALDLGHAQEALELVDTLRREDGLTVVSTLHDLTLAGQYADELLLLDAGRAVVTGPAAGVLTARGSSPGTSGPTAEVEAAAGWCGPGDAGASSRSSRRGAAGLAYGARRRTVKRGRVASDWATTQ